MNLPLALISYFDSKKVDEYLSRSISFLEPMKSPTSFHPMSRGYILISAGFFLCALGDSSVSQQSISSPLYSRIAFYLVGFTIFVAVLLGKLYFWFFFF